MKLGTRMSRREMFSRMFRPLGHETKPASHNTNTPAIQAPKVAIIQGRFCLAYRQNFCSVCVERCPEPDAILVENGYPRIAADACTGCGICRDVCPAPRNAILMLPKRET